MSVADSVLANQTNIQRLTDQPRKIRWNLVEGSMCGAIAIALLVSPIDLIMKWDSFWTAFYLAMSRTLDWLCVWKLMCPLQNERPWRFARWVRILNVGLFGVVASLLAATWLFEVKLAPSRSLINLVLYAITACAALTAILSLRCACLLRRDQFRKWVWLWPAIVIGCIGWQLLRSDFGFEPESLPDHWRFPLFVTGGMSPTGLVENVLFKPETTEMRFYPFGWSSNDWLDWRTHRVIVPAINLLGIMLLLARLGARRSSTKKNMPAEAGTHF